jgi:VWFA-related protein
MTLDERVVVDAVQVPVLVTDARGAFVRALAPDAFVVREAGQPQRLDSLVTEAMPLDLVVAVDISTSMADVIGEVQDAVQRLLTRLRDGDTSTVLGFNDTLFLLSERETDPARRIASVDGLVTWGGTALFDATVKALDLIRARKGRRGAIVFSDGADRHSAGDRESTLRRIQESDVVLYTVGFGQQTSPALRETLEAFAKASGGRAFFPIRTSELDVVFDSILEELAHQYVLSYVSTQQDAEGWRPIDVEVNCPRCRVRARDGYRRSRP